VTPVVAAAPEASVSRGPWSRPTGRAVVLLLVLAALVMTLALPLREYVQQRSQIRALERELQVRQERVDGLRDQQQLWNDPTYVELQARERLHYVYPGETGYVVLSPQDVQEAKQPEVRVATEERRAWYDTVWSSLQAADTRD
jgi:cell division protein FtsB